MTKENKESAFQYLALTGVVATIRRGGMVFPCKRLDKTPAIKNPYGSSSNDRKTLEKWCAEYPECNWGYYPALGDETVIDLDNHNGKDGKAELEKWAKSLGYEVPATRTVRTASGGLHLYFKGVSPLDKNGFLPGVDVHSRTRYVILPGSRTEKGAYEDLGGETAELPAWMIDEFEKVAPAKKDAKVVSTAPACSDDFGMVLEEIRGMSPLPQGRRDDSLIAICLGWKEKGMDYYARAALLRLMNDLGKIDPGDSPLTEDDFKRINDSAQKKASAVFGSKTLAAKLEDDIDGVLTSRELQLSNPTAPEGFIPGFLPQGISFLAGPPKFGKTIFLLQLAVSLATGTEFLGMEVPEKKKVLYLHMEGGPAQVNSRLTSIYGKDFIQPDDLIFCFSFPPLDNGGRVKLRQLVKKYNPALVIVDTWQLIREDVGGKGQTAYAKEYLELTRLKEEFLNQYGLSVLLAHHTKQTSGRDYVDDLNRLNGSTALGGFADGVILIKGARGDEVFNVISCGRSYEDKILSLVKAKPLGWKLSESPSSPLLLPETDLQRAIVQALETRPDGMTATEIKNALPRETQEKHPTDSIRRQLNRWYEDGKLDKCGKKFRVFSIVETDGQDDPLSCLKVSDEANPA